MWMNPAGTFCTYFHAAGAVCRFDFLGRVLLRLFFYTHPMEDERYEF
jgi:hypothetical protein